MPKEIAGHYIGGERLCGAATEGEPTVNPATGETLGYYAPGSAALAEQAIEAARHVFETSAWAHAPRERAAYLHRLADRIEGARAELVALIIAENGKLKREADIEVSISAAECRYYGGLACTIAGRCAEVAPYQFSSSLREAAGVAGIIVPWNAPLTLLIRSLAPALAAGCTAVVKPAPQTPLIHELIMQLVLSTPGLPAGVVNSVNENGSEVGVTLTTSPGVDVISFTGSTSTGRLIMAQAAPSLKRLSLELGGKTPILVFPDADLDSAIPQVVRHCTVMAGQMCVAGSRILVHQDIYESVRERLFSAFRSVRVGPGDDADSDMGPVIDEANRRRLEAILETNSTQILDLASSAEVAAGPGFFPATLVEVRDTESNLVQLEHFGPITTLEVFADEDDAVRKANATQFGLATSVWSRDAERQATLARRLRFGSIWQNAGVSLMPEAETGGFKQSGLGRLHGAEGLHDFLETKSIFLNAHAN
jgi:acyl-CoA reductase-like NAD-dependent aldehyde dehydrogenase